MFFNSFVNFSFTLIPIVMVALVVIVIIAGLLKRRKNNNFTRLYVQAKVVAKRTSVSVSCGAGGDRQIGISE